MNENLSPTLQRLRSFPKDNSYAKRKYPKGSKQPLSKQLAERFCDLIATSTCSIPHLLADNPDLPTFKTLETWRYRYSWFQNLWTQARKRQADFLIQHCLELAHNACPKTAHVVRVKFDVYRFVAAKFHPDLYGDKPHNPQQQTTVNVGISLTPERLNDLRVKLSQTRCTSTRPSTLKDESPTACLPGKTSDSKPVTSYASHTPVKDMKHSATDMQSVATPKT